MWRTNCFELFTSHLSVAQGTPGSEEWAFFFIETSHQFLLPVARGSVVGVNGSTKRVNPGGLSQKQSFGITQNYRVRILNQIFRCCMHSSHFEKHRSSMQSIKASTTRISSWETLRPLYFSVHYSQSGNRRQVPAGDNLPPYSYHSTVLPFSESASPAPSLNLSDWAPVILILVIVKTETAVMMAVMIACFLQICDLSDTL